MGHLTATCPVLRQSRAQNEEARLEDDGAGSDPPVSRQPGQTTGWTPTKQSIATIILICCRLDSAVVAVEQMAARRELGASQ
jgi:hypothetical protein